MYKIAVIGGSDSVIGFKALGLDAFPVEDTAEAKASPATEKASRKGYDERRPQI